MKQNSTQIGKVRKEGKIKTVILPQDGIEHTFYSNAVIFAALDFNDETETFSSQEFMHNINPAEALSAIVSFAGSVSALVGQMMIKVGMPSEEFIDHTVDEITRHVREEILEKIKKPININDEDLH